MSFDYRVAALTAWLNIACAAATGLSPLRRDVQDIAIQSDAVGRTLKYGVLLPPEYDRNQQRYPTIYLLHGLGDHYRRWAERGVEDGPWRSRAILILVDSGNSWFFNWPDATEAGADGRVRVVQRNRWEDYVVKELMADVERHFRTDPGRRALCGFSMGGYGAAMLALRHPDRFKAVAAISGAHELPRELKKRLAAGEDIQMQSPERLSSTQEAGLDVPGFSSQAERTPRSRLPEDAVFYDEHDPFNLAEQLAKRPAAERRTEWPSFLVCCGREDTMLEQSRRFAEHLRANAFAVEFVERDGGHDAAFIKPALAAALAWAADRLDK